MGRIGKTQGENDDSNPAKKAKAVVPNIAAN
jgi:hypothetical protein